MWASLSIFLVFLITSIRFSTQNITLMITPSQTDAAEISYFGKIEAKITNDEADEFGLYPESNCIKRVSRKFSLGLKPENCYLEEPTPWKLYPTYGWTPLTSIYRVQSVTLISSSEDWVILRERILENQNSQSVTLKLLGNTAKVYDTVYHQVKDKSILPGNVNVVYDKGLSYVHQWGDEEQKKYMRTLNIAGTVELVLPPNQRLTSTARVKRRISEYEVVYENVLSGEVAANFNPRYKGHHFHGIEVAQLVQGIERLYKEKLIIYTHLDDVVTDRENSGVREGDFEHE